jgi:magnesium chelatase family protein
VLAQLRTFALLGIDAVPVEVEVDTSPAREPKTVMVGLPELAVRESVHRIERAMVNLGYHLPYGRTVINLAPADLRKDAGAFDLPISLGLLVSTGQIVADKLDTFAVVGELALDGAVRPVLGALSMAMEARSRGLTRLIVPTANAREAAVVREVEVFGVGSLAEAVGVLTGAPIEPI